MKRILWLLLILSIALAGQTTGKIRTITNPEPTHDESTVPCRKLVKVAEITSNLEDEDFLVRPWFIRADSRGNFYVFDIKVRKFFKYDKEFNLVRVFGQQGQGPGEYAPGSSPLLFDIAEDDTLNVVDYAGYKFMKLDGNGKPIDEFRMYNISVLPAHPAFDARGNYFANDPERNGISLLSRQGKILHTFLSVKDFSLSLFRSIPPRMYSQWVSPDPFFTKIRHLPENRVAVYLMCTSTLYLWRDRKIEKRLRIWPREELNHFRKLISKNKPKYRDAMVPIFMEFFLDRDSRDHFFLQPPGYRPILKFSIDGKLIKRLKAPEKVFFHFKRNNLFYTTWEDRVIIFKEAS